MIKFLTICFISLFVLQNCAAQKKILLLNGKERTAATFSLVGENALYKTTDSTKAKKVDMYRVFSVIDTVTGIEQIIYNPDTTEGDLTIEEMREFVEGEQFAIRTYKSKGNNIASAAVGFSSGILAIYGVVLPPVYSLISGRFDPKIPYDHPQAPLHINNEYFKYGYQYKARKMKTQKSLMLGGIGFAVGVTTFAVIFSNLK
ncbi:MAG: hypothetical protein IPO27_15145 [Bacteroidetes bacterium]|nr:hypothetical protein [Bacteroidota bacterium]